MTAVAPSADVHPYRVEIPQSDLDDLQARLERVRWPDELAGAEWSYGVPLDYVRGLVERWRTGFDWRTHEARLNAQPQFTTTIDGQRVHFLHVRSPEPDALPLICTHGWPMSVFEYLDLAGPLSDPGAHGDDPRTRSTSSSRPCRESPSRGRRPSRTGTHAASPAPGS